MNEAIVIPTHRSGIKFLNNLLSSFKGYDKYPVVIVINDYKHGDMREFSEIKKKHSRIPITIETIETNSFEFGGLYTAYHKTAYDEFLLLPDSCEIVNPDLLDTVFKRHEGKSVAFGLGEGGWHKFWKGLDSANKEFAEKYIDKDANALLVNIGDFKYWQGHAGKFRRAILDKMDLEKYLPLNKIEAVVKGEFLFTYSYHLLDQDTVVLFSDWKDGDTYETKLGRRRMKISNEYIIKWKAYNSPFLIIDEMRASHGSIADKAKRLVQTKCPAAYSFLKETKKILSDVFLKTVNKH